MPSALFHCRFNEQPVLPFNAFGTLALARAEFDTNSASSQFFFLLKVGCVTAGAGVVTCSVSHEQVHCQQED